MSRRRVIATDGFTNATVNAQVGKNPRVVRAGHGVGVVKHGTELWSDDPIVLANPAFFVDADVVPGPRAEALSGVRGDPPPVAALTVVRIVDELMAWSGDWPPPQDAFAPDALGVTDRRLRQVLRNAGTSWQDVIMEAGARR